MQVYSFDRLYGMATNTPIANWLYEDDWTKSKLMAYEMMSQVPGLSNYMDWLLDIRKDEEYMERYGLDYSDIHDPRNLHQTSSGGSMFGAGVRISKNVDRLYR